MGGSNNRNEFLTVLEAGKSKIKVSALASGEGSLPGLQRATFLLYPHEAFFWCLHGKRELSLLFPIKLPVLSG